MMVSTIAWYLVSPIIFRICWQITKKYLLKFLEFLQDSQTFMLQAKNAAKILEFACTSAKPSSPSMQTLLWWLVSRAVVIQELSRTHILRVSALLDFGRKGRPVQNDLENPGCNPFIEEVSWFHLYASKQIVLIFGTAIAIWSNT